MRTGRTGTFNDDTAPFLLLFTKAFVHDLRPYRLTLDLMDRW